MAAIQHIFRIRRSYNQWVNNQTLEDYALRFTANGSRKWSLTKVANTALGAISFLALEAIGGAITLNYGTLNAVSAIVVVSALIFLASVPICYYASRYGVDIDLLTRGAGFGYIGSTATSLIYASFTFIFFALEAAIMAKALELLTGLPLAWGYVISSVIVIPMVFHGITFISRFQLWSQPLWLTLQILPLLVIFISDFSMLEDWAALPPAHQNSETGFSLLLFGAAASVMFALVAQIGEQVDFLRFLPEKNSDNRYRWWLAMLAGGPGWIVIGMLKLLAGSFLAFLALSHGMSMMDAADPTAMYTIAFSYLTQSPNAALLLAGVFVILSQLKINVTNAYAGSIAWSNFFSRLTHSHPGRVVWLIFNVCIALLLMELGVYHAFEKTLSVYAIVAVAWVGTLVADLVINKPLGLSPNEKRVRQILINLLSNAVKFTPKGEVELSIRYRNQVAEIRVRDTGVGIPENELERIFKPFERIRLPGAPVVSGTGLGLTITKLLVDIMGGDLVVTANPNGGVTFSVWLMLAHVYQMPSEVVKEKIYGYMGQKRSLLIVDDDPAHRGLMHDLLAPLGFTVVEAPDAESCLSVLKIFSPDAFLIDRRMPGINGPELARKLRSLNYRQPIIMVSANANEDAPPAESKPAYDDYLIKPIRLDSLLEKLGQHLNLTWDHQQRMTDMFSFSSYGGEKLPSDEILEEMIGWAEVGALGKIRDLVNRLEEENGASAQMIQRFRNCLDQVNLDDLIDTVRSVQGTPTFSQSL